MEAIDDRNIQIDEVRMSERRTIISTGHPHRFATTEVALLISLRYFHLVSHVDGRSAFISSYFINANSAKIA
jgi:hypothetical protein